MFAILVSISPLLDYIHGQKTGIYYLHIYSLPNQEMAEVELFCIRSMSDAFPLFFYVAVSFSLPFTALVRLVGWDGPASLSSLSSTWTPEGFWVWKASRSATDMFPVMCALAPMSSMECKRSRFGVL